MKTVLTRNMNGGLDSAVNRVALAAKEGEKVKAMITVPRQIQTHIHEGFEPLLVIAEMVDKHLIIILNAIMDFDDATQQDAHFIDLMKDVVSYALGDTIDELQDGFENGMQDVVILFRENLKGLIEAAAGPEMAPFVGGLGTDQIMSKITAAYTFYRQD